VVKTKYYNVWINPSEKDIGDNRALIGFDLDAVLNSGLSRCITERLAKHYGVGIDNVRNTHPIHGYEMFNLGPNGSDVQEVMKIVETSVIEDSPSVLSSPWMKEVMDFVYQATGDPITVITSRNPNALDVTHNWLVQWLDDLPFNCYIMHGRGKGAPIAMLGLSIFVDDRWKTINNLLSWCEYPVLFQRPWNRFRPDPLPVLEIRDLRDIIPLVNIKLGRNPMDWPYWVPFPKPEGERITKKYVTIL
jgi:hypothetical protein